MKLLFDMWKCLILHMDKLYWDRNEMKCRLHWKITDRSLWLSISQGVVLCIWDCLIFLCFHFDTLKITTLQCVQFKFSLLMTNLNWKYCCKIMGVSTDRTEQCNYPQSESSKLDTKPKIICKSRHAFSVLNTQYLEPSCYHHKL